MKLRALIAVWAGKFTTKICKLSGKGGTSLPGKVALKLCPDILKHLSGKMQIICVTGTNGKTTTCHIIRDMITELGKKVFCNDAGANMLGGVVAAFVNNACMNGKIDCDVALLECDEASLRGIVEYFGEKEVYVVVTNVFRDQLDRYGEVLTTVNKIRQGLEKLPNAKLVLNADCSLTSSLSDVKNKGVYYFGVDVPLYEESSSDISDAVYCIKCRTRYKYKYHTFGHLGGYYCEKCGYERHKADVGLWRVVEWKDASSVVEMRIFDKKVETEVMLPGGYNLYNALAATCVASLFGLGSDRICKVLRCLTSHFGRMETVDLDGNKLHLTLVKNPAGFNEVLQFLIQRKPEGSIVFGLNDNYADGKDISWIYDVEFERLTEAAKNARKFYFTGKRAYDMQLRLKYADFDCSKFVVEKNYADLIEDLRRSGAENERILADSIDASKPAGSLELRSGAEDIYLVLSYTCMLEFRDELSKFVELAKYSAE